MGMKNCDKCKGTGLVPSELDSLTRLLGLKLSREQNAACRYLESKGLSFCVDFGYENAFAMAFDHMESESVQ